MAAHNAARVKRGMVIRCSRNSFTVQTVDGASVECHIKGKVLKDSGRFYNPLAPGDMVNIEEDAGHPGTGRVVSLEKRRNMFSRFNAKGQAPQLLAANADAVLCLTTPESPPFRPRFLDRVLVQAEAAAIDAVIVCNKCDLGFEDPDVEERLEDFTRIGYTVFRVSAKTGEALDALAAFISGKTVVLIGQSGTGKSSLINALAPGLDIKTGALNEKYDRGNHTTVMPVMFELPLGAYTGGGTSVTRIIDTPGIRLFVPHGIAADDVILHLREFAPLAGQCSYGLSCSHRTETGCKIIEAVQSGLIHEDRYNSFLRISAEISGSADRNYGD
jgi:ribosome biogenesis GTPase